MELPKGLNWLKLFLKFSFILVILNGISLVMTVVYGVDITVAAISFLISVAISFSCYLIIKSKAK